MSDPSSYVIRGGIQGRERLRVLSRIMHESTTRLLDRVGLESGMTCLDAGCGGGDATLELARRVGPDGKVLGIDMDATKIEIARAEAVASGVTNVEYRVGRVDDPMDASFDVIYARFLLTHLPDPLHVCTTVLRVAAQSRDDRPRGHRFLGLVRLPRLGGVPPLPRALLCRGKATRRRPGHRPAPPFVLASLRFRGHRRVRRAADRHRRGDEGHQRDHDGEHRGYGDRSGTRVSRGGRHNRTRAVRVRRQSGLGCRDPANRAGVGQDTLPPRLVICQVPLASSLSPCRAGQTLDGPS